MSELKLVPVSAMVPDSLMESLRKVADANARSVSGEIRLAIRNHVERCEERAA